MYIKNVFIRFLASFGAFVCLTGAGLMGLYFQGQNLSSLGVFVCAAVCLIVSYRAFKNLTPKS